MRLSTNLSSEWMNRDSKRGTVLLQGKDAFSGTLIQPGQKEGVQIKFAVYDA